MLDSALLDANGATAARPAGLRYNIAATTAGASFAADIDALVSAVVTGGGSPDNIVFVMHPARRYRALIAAGNAGNSFDIIPSAQIASNIAIALDIACIASAIGTPDVSSSRETLLHYEDTNPAQVSTSGTPNVVAAPLRSAFQQDLVAARLVLPASWALRQPGAIAWLTATAW